MPNLDKEPDRRPVPAMPYEEVHRRRLRRIAQRDDEVHDVDARTTAADAYEDERWRVTEQGFAVNDPPTNYEIHGLGWDKWDDD